MQHRIVSSKEIENDPQHRLDADHYINPPLQVTDHTITVELKCSKCGETTNPSFDVETADEAYVEALVSGCPCGHNLTREAAQRYVMIGE